MLLTPFALTLKPLSPKLKPGVEGLVHHHSTKIDDKP